MGSWNSLWVPWVLTQVLGDNLLWWPRHSNQRQNRMRLLHMDLYTLFNISNLLCSMRGSTDATWSLLITFVFLNVVLEHTFFYFYNSSIVDLQCHVSLRFTTQWFSFAYICFPCGSAGKESTCNADSILELGRSPGEGKGYQLQYSGLENPMDYVVHGVTKSWTRLSDFHFTSLQSQNISLPAKMGYAGWLSPHPQVWRPLREDILSHFCHPHP